LKMRKNQKRKKGILQEMWGKKALGASEKASRSRRKDIQRRQEETPNMKPFGVQRKPGRGQKTRQQNTVTLKEDSPMATGRIGNWKALDGSREAGGRGKEDL